MTDSGKCAFVLGIELLNAEDGSVTLCQRRYVDDLLKRFSMSDCKAVSSPVDMSSRLVSSDAAIKANVPFREAVGALMHLTTATRPYIAYAVGYVSRFMENPQDITGLRSSAYFAIYKALRSMGYATSLVTRSIFVDIRMQIRLATSLTASQLPDTRSCYWVRHCQQGRTRADDFEDNQSCIKMTIILSTMAVPSTSTSSIMTKALHGPRHKEMTQALGIRTCLH
ncbi:unnamed protein product [Peronospora belbahrii]|uniref:Reverse transcriptase Ty1/copia-type domain-containing protein n=1 Tax=Peronospora belbahrii TaxID=622444 RepID=A0ABN8D2D4_9STRA|nr:unnamed protein product [Peronospora belbahrii]